MLNMLEPNFWRMLLGIRSSIYNFPYSAYWIFQGLICLTNYLTSDHNYLTIFEDPSMNHCLSDLLIGSALRPPNFFFPRRRYFASLLLCVVASLARYMPTEWIATKAFVGSGLDFDWDDEEGQTTWRAQLGEALVRMGLYRFWAQVAWMEASLTHQESDLLICFLCTPPSLRINTVKERLYQSRWLHRLYRQILLSDHKNSINRIASARCRWAECIN